MSLAEVFEARGTGIMTAPRGTSRHWTCHRVISRRESPFMVLAKQNILNAKREKRTFCARLLHPQTRLMHPDRTHPSTMIQAYSSNTLKSPSLRTQLASPPYNDKCGARTHDQLSTEKRPLAALRANEHVSASCHCHPLSINSGLASNSKQPNPQPIERTV